MKKYMEAHPEVSLAQELHFLIGLVWAILPH